MKRKALFGALAIVLTSPVALHYPALGRSAYEQDYDCLVKFRSASTIDQVSHDCQQRAPGVVHMLDKQVDQAYDQVHDYQRKLDTECKLDHKDPDKIRLNTRKSFLDSLSEKLPSL